MTIARALRPLGAWLLVLTLAACGGSADPTGGGGDDGAAADDDDEQQWELSLPDGTSVIGTSAVQSDDVTIVLSDSAPAGWTVTFVTEEALSTDAGGFYASDNASNRVTVTLQSPSSASCSAPPGASGGDRSILVYAGVADGVPLGSGGLTASCFGSPSQETYDIGFGAL
jgi:hypothetical protein